MHDVSPDEAALTFEQALARLEEIATLIDRNEIALAEALALCSEATRLFAYCRQQLTEAEGKLERLVESAGGGTQLEPLDPQ